MGRSDPESLQEGRQEMTRQTGLGGAQGPTLGERAGLSEEQSASGWKEGDGSLAGGLCGSQFNRSRLPGWEDGGGAAPWACQHHQGAGTVWASGLDKSGF